MTAPLPAEKVEALAKALRSSRLSYGTHADRWNDQTWQSEFWTEAAETVAPLVAGWLAEEREGIAAAIDALRDPYLRSSVHHRFVEGADHALEQAVRIARGDA